MRVSIHTHGSTVPLHPAFCFGDPLMHAHPNLSLKNVWAEILLAGAGCKEITLKAEL